MSYAGFSGRMLRKWLWYGAFPSTQVTKRSQSSALSVTRFPHGPSRSAAISLLRCEPNASGWDSASAGSDLLL